MIDFGKNLKRIRNSKDITLDGLSKLVDISAVSLSRYETGQREPSFQTIEKLSKALNVDINELIGTNEPKTSNVDLDELVKQLYEMKSDPTINKVAQTLQRVKNKNRKEIYADLFDAMVEKMEKIEKEK